MKEVKQYWEEFISKKPEYQGKKYSSWYFGYNKEMANRLASLVVEGEKTGTSSLELGYVIDEEEIPKIGEISIITNFNNIPQCIIENTQVSKIKFKDITEDHALLEGEGDKTLEYWQENHEAFFKEETKDLGTHFSTELFVIFEEFKVIKK